MLYGILTICFITFISDLTPGPNFWKIVFYTLNGGRARSTVFIFGLSVASTLHCALGFLGVSALVASHEMALVAIQLLGGGYIAWYGLQMLFTRRRKTVTTAPVDQAAELAFDDKQARPEDSRTPVRARRVFIDGVLTNFSNPKTILFYASLFAMTLTPANSPAYNLTVMACLLLTSLLTNLLVANVFAFKPIERLFKRWERAICRVIGGLLILGGLKIAFQQRG